MPYIKNIAQETILELTKEVSIQQGQITSKTLAQNAHVSLTLFAFSKGEEISTHASSGDAMVTILEGVATIVIDGTSYTLQTGETIVMPANKPHSVHASEDFKMLLSVIFPTETQTL